MNRLLFQAATATGNTSRLPGILRLDMSILRRLIGHGRALFRYHIETYGSRNPVLFHKLDPFISGRSSVIGGTSSGGQQFPVNGPLDWIGRQISSGWRKLFVTNVLNRVTNSLSNDLRTRASNQLLYGNNSRPFFALVGVSLASGAGILTKDQEFEGICWEIKESLQKKQNYGIVNTVTKAYEEEELTDENAEITLKDLKFGPLIAQGSSAAVYSARWNNQNVTEDDSDSYPLGVKMMFNFYCESNSVAILRGMARELVPATENAVSALIGDGPQLAGGALGNLLHSPPHPNVIQITHAFTDSVPLLSGSFEKYPDALPRRLNQDGLGRNASLFLVMKRYDTNLQTYLRDNTELRFKTRLLLLAQLLEGITHLNANSIAHRDLKTDNLLLDLTTESEYPHLVITDFGCCLADKSNGLQLPFPSMDMDRGGNAALMAPEVSTAKPGSWTKISYTKSDPWSAGAIAYEIFGHVNPFTNGNLDPRSYQESELPEIQAPLIIKSLINGLLKRKPSNRLSAEVAANICGIHCWGPSRWLISENAERVTDSEIMQWLLTLTTKLLCSTPEDSTKLEFSLIRSFLSRLSFNSVRASLDWIRIQTRNK